MISPRIHTNRESGPIARVAPNHLLTSSPELWARINAVRSPYKRAEWYYHAARFKPGEDNVFTECDNDKHDVRRKKLASGVGRTYHILLRFLSNCSFHTVLWKGKFNPGVFH